MNTDSTPKRLLTAARRLFAERGYEGASIRLITARARANLGAVTYHFGSKQQLYYAVLSEFTVSLGDKVVALATAPAPAMDRIATVIEATTTSSPASLPTSPSCNPRARS
jgi:AcrR family transcriptional regulator